MLRDSVPFDAADATQFPLGRHRVKVKDRGLCEGRPYVTVQGTGARQVDAFGTGRPGQAGTLEVTEVGDVDVRLSAGTLLLVRDGTVLWKGDREDVMSAQLETAERFAREEHLTLKQKEYTWIPS